MSCPRPIHVSGRHSPSKVYPLQLFASSIICIIVTRAYRRAVYIRSSEFDLRFCVLQKRNVIHTYVAVVEAATQQSCICI